MNTPNKPWRLTIQDLAAKPPHAAEQTFTTDLEAGDFAASYCTAGPSRKAFLRFIHPTTGRLSPSSEWTPTGWKNIA
jgi:hypothetical protein